MYNSKKEEENLVEIDGAFYWGEWQLIPFNHWKNDCEWLVVVPEGATSAVFITVTALSPQEACLLATIQYKNAKEEMCDE